MADASHTWGADLELGPTGDLAVAEGAGETQQRILRRLLTVRGDDLWDLEYGAGLPARVGEIANAGQLAALVREQLALESSVQQTPEPVVSVSASPDGTVFLNVRYADAATGETETLAFPVRG